MEYCSEEKLQQLTTLAINSAHGFVCELMTFGSLVKNDERKWIEWLTGKASPSDFALELNCLDAVEIPGFERELRWKSGKKDVLNARIADLIAKAKAFAEAFEGDEHWLHFQFAKARHELFPNPKDAVLQWHWKDIRDDDPRRFGLHITPAVCHVHGASAHGFVYSLCVQVAQSFPMFGESMYADCFLAFLIDDRLTELLLQHAEEPHLRNECAAAVKVIGKIDDHKESKKVMALTRSQFPEKLLLGIKQFLEWGESCDVRIEGTIQDTLRLACAELRNDVRIPGEVHTSWHEAAFQYIAHARESLLCPNGRATDFARWSQAGVEINQPLLEGRWPWIQAAFSSLDEVDFADANHSLRNEFSKAKSYQGLGVDPPTLELIHETARDGLLHAYQPVEKGCRSGLIGCWLGNYWWRGGE